MPSRLSTIASKATVREYAQGVAQSSVAPVADFLAPTVEVSGPSGYFKVYDDKNRFVIPDTSRALGGSAARLGWDKSDKQFNCRPNALDVPVDVAEGDAEDSMEAALQEAADLGAEVGSLAHEKKVLDIALTTLGAGTSFDFGANVDVIDVLDQEIIAVSKGAGYGSLMGIGLLMGPTFARKLKNHPLVRARITGGGKKDAANPTIDQLIDLLMLKPEVRLSAMILDTAPQGKAAARDFILDNTCIVFARKESPTRRDPSFMKTFRLRKSWMAPRVYTEADGRTEVAAMDWSVDVQATNSAAGKRLNGN